MDTTKHGRKYGNVRKISALNRPRYFSAGSDNEPPMRGLGKLSALCHDISDNASIRTPRWILLATKDQRMEMQVTDS